AGCFVLSTVLVPWPEIAAAVLLAGATYVAIWGLRNAPESSCGCLGGLAAARVGRATAFRAGALAAMAALAAFSPDGWTAVFSEPLALLVVLPVGALVIWYSSERDDLWERVRPGMVWPGRVARHEANRVRNAACRRRSVPLESSLARLRGSELWTRAQPFVQD